MQLEVLKMSTLTGKYAKLRDDIRTALEIGERAEAENPDDGGTCNLDCVMLTLPRATESKVVQAAHEAGWHIRKSRFYGQTVYMLNPRTNGQANARSRNAEAVAKALRDMGYDAMDYCQMD
jgi:hypothetical protein